MDKKMNKKLQIWWIPQIPMKPFTFPVDSIEEGIKLMDILAEYDKFQYDNNIKPDYFSICGLEQWSEDSDGNGTPGWEDWYDEETCTDDLREYLKLKK